MINIQPARNRRKFFRPSKFNSRSKIHIPKPLMQQRPKPKTAAEQQRTGHQADGGPTNQRGATVGLVHQMHNFASLQAGNVNVILQTSLHLSRRFLYSLRQHAARTFLRFLHRCVEFGDRCTNLDVYVVHCVVKNELVHGDQGDCRIVWLEKDIVAGRDLRDEPLGYDRAILVRHTS